MLKKQIETLVRAEIENNIFSAEELQIAKDSPLWYRNIDFELGA